MIPREIFQVVVVARDRLPDEHRRDAVRGAQRLDHQFIFAVGRDDARGLGRQRGRVVPHRHPVADSDGPDEARDRQLLDQRGEEALVFVGHFKCFDEPFPVRRRVVQSAEIVQPIHEHRRVRHNPRPSNRSKRSRSCVE